MSNNYNASVKIGYAVGWLLISFIRFIFSGIFIAPKKHKLLLLAYPSIIFGIIITYISHGKISFFVFLFFATAICSSFGNYISEYPLKKRKEYFKNVFKEAKLLAKNGSTPIYLHEEQISNYILSVAFHSLIPLTDWQSKKELIEMYFNEKIIKIKQDENDNRITHVDIEVMQLPENIPWEERYIDYASHSFFALGMGYYGRVILDLKKHPHIFVAGATGSGKSNILKCLIHQAIIKNYDVILIDFKRAVSFSSFSDVVEIYYEYEPTMKILEGLVQETKDRLDAFRIDRVDNIDEYNLIGGAHFQRKIIFIDELAELLKVNDKEIAKSLYDSIETLTRLSRAVGIHLIMGIQRPDSTIVNGQIKNNVSYRVCGRFVDKEPSRIMLGTDVASNLPNIKGRFIVNDNELEEVQCFYYEDNNTHNAKKEPVAPEIKKDNESIPEEKTEVRKNVSENIIFDFSDIEK